MTKTLVERLREPITDGDGDCDLREEAANEIERLQRDLEAEMDRSSSLRLHIELHTVPKKTPDEPSGDA